ETQPDGLARTGGAVWKDQFPAGGTGRRICGNRFAGLVRIVEVSTPKRQERTGAFGLRFCAGCGLACGIPTAGNARACDDGETTRGTRAGGGTVARARGEPAGDGVCLRATVNA